MNLKSISRKGKTIETEKSWDFSGGLVVESSPSNAGGVSSIPGQEAKIPHASGPKNQNIKRKQHCNKFNKDLKKRKKEKSSLTGGTKGGWRDWTQRAQGKFLAWQKLSYILSLGVDTWLYMFVKIHKISHQKEWILLYVKLTSVFKDRCPSTRLGHSLVVGMGLV